MVSSPFAYSLTVKRNKEWKDNRTLYAADLTKAPESYRIVAFNAMNVTQDAEQATDKVRKDSLFRAAIVLFERAYSIFPDYKMMYMNWGFSYLSLGNPDSAEWAWGRQRVLFPESRYNDYNRELLSKARYDQCMQEYNQHYRDGGNYDYLKSILLKAIKYRPEEAAGWTLLGKVYYLNSQRDSARIVWRKALELDTANVEVRSLLSMQ